jgi:hypothetical protein
MAGSSTGRADGRKNPVWIPAGNGVNRETVSDRQAEDAPQGLPPLAGNDVAERMKALHRDRAWEPAYS